jgi:hypothetical protein|tara:strand:+ start:1419 stop:1562 length:144 start_codon:yes stop_codon:yes gene_type:complete
MIEAQADSIQRQLIELGQYLDDNASISMHVILQNQEILESIDKLKEQ